MEKIWLPLLLSFFAGICTVIGSLIALSITRIKKKYLCFFLGLSAGVMIYVSLVELLGEGIETLGFGWGNVAFFSGMLFIMLIDFLIPHNYIQETTCRQVNKKHHRIMKAGVFTAIGIAIHNFPEGMAVFVSSVEDISLGISLALAIAIHNIPEGIAVAMPIYYATKSRKQAFFYSFLSGLAEPVGALLCALLLMPFLNETILAFSLAFVGGIMVFISFDELLPLSFEGGKCHLSVMGVILGMIIMASSLHLF